MGNKKTNNMSLAIDEEMQDTLKRVAKRKEVSVSKLIRDMVEKYLTADEDVYTVILKIPATLKSDPAALRKWLEVRTTGIIKALT